MLRLLGSGWSSSRPDASNAASQAGPSNTTEDVEEYDDEPPSFPMPGSIQRAAGSSRGTSITTDVQLDVSPPSPSSSAGSSSPPTPKASVFNAPRSRPAPSHKPFPPESDSAKQGLALPPSTTAVPPKRSKKVALKPGHSALDWARLMKEGGDELRAGFDTPQRITLSEVAEHRKRDDAWSVFHGRVYNITPYLDYHPGGAGELMRVAGTELFMKTHAWVNAELMMEACMIGILVRET